MKESFESSIFRLAKLANDLKSQNQLNGQINRLLQDEKVISALKKFSSFQFASRSFKKVFLSILAIGQEKNVFGKKPPQKKTLQQLVEIDLFYKKMGGLIGYQLMVLKLLCPNRKEVFGVFKRPPGIDLQKDRKKKLHAVWEGIKTLPYLGEIYPVGGLGARLNLRNSKNFPLPVASLNFAGRSLLESLFRDLEAKEYLHYKLTGGQLVIPAALMTSKEQNNHRHILQLLKKNRWFNRPREKIKLFSQLSVPVVTEKGDWTMLPNGELNLQPNGHGALWRSGEKKKIFQWLIEEGVDRILIRQINNPISGIDDGLFAFIGKGSQEEKSFGFMACERLVNAAEGVLILSENDIAKTITNVEYTDFKKAGIEDEPNKLGFSSFPANTNILFANLHKILPILSKHPHPGLILNLKASVLKGRKKIRVGRLESMMQNIADVLAAPATKKLQTFVVYNDRKKTISTTKRSFEKEKSLLETPEGAFYDLLENNYALLKQCGFTLPALSSPQEYLSSGPSIYFLYHPALGPIYSVIAQKLKGGFIEKKSNLQLEISEALISNLHLKGGLYIHATNPLGARFASSRQFSDEGGKCILKNVSVINSGPKKKKSEPFWKNSFSFAACMRIICHGNGEFYAENVTFSGSWLIDVPPGERWVARQEDGKITILKEEISKHTWKWNFTLNSQKEMILHLSDAAPTISTSLPTLR